MHVTWDSNLTTYDNPSFDAIVCIELQILFFRSRLAGNSNWSIQIAEAFLSFHIHLIPVSTALNLFSIFVVPWGSVRYPKSLVLAERRGKLELVLC